MPNMDELADELLEETSKRKVKKQPSNMDEFADDLLAETSAPKEKRIVVGERLPEEKIDLAVEEEITKTETAVKESRSGLLPEENIDGILKEQEEKAQVVISQPEEKEDLMPDTGIPNIYADNPRVEKYIREEEYDKDLKKEDVSDFWQDAGEVAKSLTPIYGTALLTKDYIDEWDNLSDKEKALGVFWVSLSTVGDVAMVVGVGTALKATAVAKVGKLGKLNKIKGSVNVEQPDEFIKAIEDIAGKAKKNKVKTSSIESSSSTAKAIDELTPSSANTLVKKSEKINVQANTSKQSLESVNDVSQAITRKGGKVNKKVLVAEADEIAEIGLRGSWSSMDEFADLVNKSGIDEVKVTYPSKVSKSAFKKLEDAVESLEETGGLSKSQLKNIVNTKANKTTTKVADAKLKKLPKGVTVTKIKPSSQKISKNAKLEVDEIVLKEKPIKSFYSGADELAPPSGGGGVGTVTKGTKPTTRSLVIEVVDDLPSIGKGTKLAGEGATISIASKASVTDTEFIPDETPQTPSITVTDTPVIAEPLSPALPEIELPTIDLPADEPEAIPVKQPEAIPVEVASPALPEIEVPTIDLPADEPEIKPIVQPRVIPEKADDPAKQPESIPDPVKQPELIPDPATDPTEITKPAISTAPQIYTQPIPKTQAQTQAKTKLKAPPKAIKVGVATGAGRFKPKLKDTSQSKNNNFKYPRRVGWKQGVVYAYQDLTTGQRFFSKEPVYGKVTRSSSTPKQSMKTVLWGKQSPRKRTFELGNAIVSVGTKTISFSGGIKKASKRKSSRRKKR